MKINIRIEITLEELKEIIENSFNSGYWSCEHAVQFVDYTKRKDYIENTINELIKNKI